MFQKLPKEMVIEIFKNLSHTDLLTVSEVSKRFCEIATDPILWKDFDISQVASADKINLLQLSRFQKLKTLTLRAPTRDQLLTIARAPTRAHDFGDENKILELLMNIDLEELRLERFNFKKIDKDLLTSVICKTKRVEILNIELQKLGKEIIEKIPGGNIKELRLTSVDFSGMDSQTLAKSINKLKVFMPQYCFFDQSHIMEIIEEMLRETNLKKLCLPTIILNSVPARILSEALNKMELLILYGPKISPEQMMEIFREMSGQTNLRSLTLDLPDSIVPLPADLITKAINNLTRFEAGKLNFSESQIMSLFHNIATNDSCRIRHLNLRMIFRLVDLKTLRAVNNKLTEISDFKRCLSVKIVEMSIAELLKYEEEGEEKLSDEEMCQRWAQVICEALETVQSLRSCHSFYTFSTLRDRLKRAFTTPLLLQMRDSNKYNLFNFYYNIFRFW